MSRILVIEDNADGRELITYLLVGAGHELIVAAGGAEGLALARSASPELILLDLHMPRVDGFQVIRALRADPELRAMPVVAVTAVAMVGDRETILAAGFDGYVSKPISPETLVEDVEAFLPAAQRAG